MIVSMTGYGKKILENPSRKISIEIKSLNSKQADVSVKLPFILREKDMEIRNEIAKRLERGKIDCNIFIESTSPDKPVVINEVVVGEYHRQLTAVADKLGLDKSDLLPVIMRLPEVFQATSSEIDPVLWTEVHQTLLAAIEAHIEFRIAEGKRLRDDILPRVELIHNLLLEVETFENDRMQNIRQRIKNNLLEHLKEELTDQNRLEQELIYYIEKIDFSEEKARLRSHCIYFKQTADKEDAPGRKLGFISQEMGREINTLGSKANHAEIQKRVVQMKDELEKIKEQLLNIL